MATRRSRTKKKKKKHKRYGKHTIVLQQLFLQFSGTLITAIYVHFQFTNLHGREQGSREKYIKLLH